MRSGHYVVGNVAVRFEIVTRERAVAGAVVRRVPPQQLQLDRVAGRELVPVAVQLEGHLAGLVVGEDVMPDGNQRLITRGVYRASSVGADLASPWG